MTRSFWLALAMGAILLPGCRAKRQPVAPRVHHVVESTGDIVCVPYPCAIPYQKCIPVPLPPVGDPRELIDPAFDQPWELSLEEATRIALDNSEVVRVLQGDQTRAEATTYDPGIVATEVQTALSAFDASVGAGMFWQRNDLPPRTGVEGQFLRREQLDLANFNAFVTKPLLTGGRFDVIYDTSYNFFPPNLQGAQVFTNPQYFPTLTYALSQPLLRGAGRDVNYAPTLIARAQADQSSWEFQNAMLGLARSVEEAYWEIYSAQAVLKAIDESLPLYEEVVRVGRARIREEATAEVDIAQAETRYYEVQRLRIEAANNVVNAAAELRNVLGLPPSDSRPIVITTLPFRGEMLINWDQTIDIAMDERPDIIQERLAIYIAQQQLLVARNSYRIQLDVGAFWRINGLGTDLNEAIDLLSTNRFADWNLGFQASVPIGRRQAQADIRESQLSLRRQRALLEQTVHAAVHDLARIVRDINAIYGQVEVAAGYQDIVLNWRNGARARYFNPVGDISALAALNSYLQSVRAWADARRELAILVAQYNVGLARLEEAKGTLLQAAYTEVYDDPVDAAARILNSHPETVPERPNIEPPPSRRPILAPSIPFDRLAVEPKNSGANREGGAATPAPELQKAKEKLDDQAGRTATAPITNPRPSSPDATNEFSKSGRPPRGPQPKTVIRRPGTSPLANQQSNPAQEAQPSTGSRRRTEVGESITIRPPNPTPARQAAQPSVPRRSVDRQAVIDGKQSSRFGLGIGPRIFRRTSPQIARESRPWVEPENAQPRVTKVLPPAVDERKQTTPSDGAPPLVPQAAPSALPRALPPVAQDRGTHRSAAPDSLPLTTESKSRVANETVPPAIREPSKPAVRNPIPPTAARTAPKLVEQNRQPAARNVASPRVGAPDVASDNITLPVGKARPQIARPAVPTVRQDARSRRSVEPRIQIRAERAAPQQTDVVKRGIPNTSQLPTKNPGRIVMQAPNWRSDHDRTKMSLRAPHQEKDGQSNDMPAVRLPAENVLVEPPVVARIRQQRAAKPRESGAARANTITRRIRNPWAQPEPETRTATNSPATEKPQRMSPAQPSGPDLAKDLGRAVSELSSARTGSVKQFKELEKTTIGRAPLELSIAGRSTAAPTLGAPTPVATEDVDAAQPKARPVFRKVRTIPSSAPVPSRHRLQYPVRSAANEASNDAELVANGSRSSTAFAKDLGDDEVQQPAKTNSWRIVPTARPASPATTQSPPRRAPARWRVTDSSQVIQPTGHVEPIARPATKPQ